MKALIVRVTVILLVSVALFTHVFAQDNGDPSAVNKLLSDGATEVTADKLLQEVVFDKKTDWELFSDDSTKLAIAKGVYQMSSKGNIIAWGLNNSAESNLVIQVKTKQTSKNTDNAYGVMCRAEPSNNGDGYYFQISGDGFYTITMRNGDWTTLVDWAESKAINAGQDENEITAVCAGSYLALYVNDVLLAETNDDTFSNGNTGLTVSAFADSKDVVVEFDDVQIWSASVSGGATTASKPTTSADVPDSLTSYDGKPKEAIAELEQLGVIPSGSSQIFNENYAYFTGQGNWFTPLASRSPHKNIAMAGELTFTVGSTDAFESCTLMSRIKTNNQGTATSYIQVGIANDGFAFIYDLFSEAQDGQLMIGATQLDLKVPHHLLFTVIDDVANIYLDGNLEIAQFKVGERSGTYGISLGGRGPKARCDGRNLWAFAVPSVKPGECAVTTTKVANKRSGPGTTFEAAGQLAAGDEVLVSGQAKGSDGKSWWQLQDETWVRADLVTAIGDCANVPIVKL